MVFTLSRAVPRDAAIADTTALTTAFMALPGASALWLADTGVVDIGDAVESWTAAAGTGTWTKASDGTRPTLTTLSNRPAITFDGSEVLQMTAPNISAWSSVTIAIRYKQNDDSRNPQYLFSYNISPNRWRLAEYTNENDQNFFRLFYHPTDNVSVDTTIRTGAKAGNIMKTVVASHGANGCRVADRMEIASAENATAFSRALPTLYLGSLTSVPNDFSLKGTVLGVGLLNATTAFTASDLKRLQDIMDAI